MFVESFSTGLPVAHDHVTFTNEQVWLGDTTDGVALSHLDAMR